MKNLFLTVFTALTLFAAPTFLNAQTSSAQANREMKLWQTFQPAGLNFRVDLPKPPEDVYLPDNDNEFLIMKMIRLRMPSAKYVVSVIQFRNTNLTPEEIKELVIEAAKEVTEGGLVIGNELFISQKHASKANRLISETTVEKNGTTIKTKHYLTKNAAYIVQAAMPDLHIAPPQLVEIIKAEADKFFNSFEILDNKKPATETKNVKGKKR